MFVPYSHGNGNTYSSRIWFDRYWETNSWGYRDREHGLKEASQKTKVMFLGDSFVAGHGIKNPADRISDIVAEEMGDQFEIHNLGRNGADSKVELKNLVAYPVKPDIVILSHIPNDIEHVNQPGTQQGFGPSQSTPDQEMVIPEPHLAGIGFLRFLSEGSFTLNYIYWKFNGFIEGVESVDLQEKPEDFGDSYITRYFDPPALAEHHADLQQIISWCKIREIPLLFLTFPETYDGAIDFTQNEINLPLANWLRPQNIPVLHAYDALKPIPMKDRIVNFNDLHPSEQAHQAVAELLMQKLKELGWLD
jgi:lysophospholipase L1-like esterase